MPTAPSTPWQLVIHGGAGLIERGKIERELEAAIRAALQRALDAGAAILAAGGASLDAVEAAIVALEDDPHFNAGHGAVLSYEGKSELDAAIMEGTGRKAGAVAGATATKNPIRLARAVMEHSPHVMLAGEGADTFSREQAVEQADPGYFATAERKRQLGEMKADTLNWFDVDMKYGTVGAVALDGAGHVAAGTSTGGVTGKRWGRIGDSPIIGAGTYADDRACAISATGSGEYFIRVGVAHEIGARMRMKGETAKAATDAVLKEMADLGGSGGIIVVSPKGEAEWSFTTPGMYRGKASAGGSTVAIFGDE